MKKALLALLVIILLGQSTYAQTGFGVKAGYNLSMIKVDGSDYYETNYRHGYNIGMFLNFPIKEKFSLETDLLFTTAGGWGYRVGEARVEGTNAYESYHDEFFMINYLAIPVVGKYTFGPVNVHAGPQLSILTRALLEDNHRGYRNYIDSTFTFREENSSWYTKTKDVQQFYKMIDIGFVAGLGCEIDRFYFAARYYIGLMNVSTREHSFKNSYIQASVGWRLSEDY